jgi:hypothetical protein
MDDGRTQWVDVPITEVMAMGEFTSGMRVQLTEKGKVRRM